MCAPDAVSYALLLDLLKPALGPLHAATLAALTDLVGALLRSQSLHPADLARALPTLRTARARQALRRVQRIVGRAAQQHGRWTPWLLRAALRLVPPGPVLLVLDSTRCRRWEIFTLGLVFHGRVLPLAWRVLPYPWPKKQFTPTVLALLEHVWAQWPPTRPVHLLADRGFPSLKLFRHLAYWRTCRALDYTIRLRASDWVRQADGTAVAVRDLEQAAPRGTWTVQPAAYQQRHQAPAAVQLVLGHGEPVYPAHQQGPADQARRAARAVRRTHHVRSKHQPHSPTTDRVWALLTTAPTAGAAVAAYTQRFHTEGTYRDLKSWQLTAVVAHDADAAHVTGLVSLAALGYLLQASLGAAAGQTTEPVARARQAQWCTTDRLSVFWRGRQVLHDRAHDWRPWLATQLPRLQRVLRGLGPPPAQEAA